MKNPLKKLASNKIIKIAASLKLTVVCLVILAALVVWGTVYQAEHGLYQAQQKFFHSWFFLIFGFIPFPGTVLIMFVLFLNLVCAIIFRIPFRFSNLGNIITHTGIIVLLVGGFFTFYFSEESSLMLKEGETSQMSESRHLWELAIWEQKSGERDIYAVDTEDFDAGDSILIEDLNLELQIKEYYKNCSAFTGITDSSMVENKMINASGIQVLKALPNAAEVTDNTAGVVFGVFYINPATGPHKTLLLYGEDTLPTPVTINSHTLFFSLRKKKIVLPLSITLKDFKVTFYPNSTIPKSYESRVSIKAEGGIKRDVVISMNKPLRYRDLTFFQSSYFISSDGSEYTILAVVKNFGRLLPYFSSILIFLGLVIHFLAKLFKSKKKGPLNHGARHL
jgi:hypothetical protein